MVKAGVLSSQRMHRFFGEFEPAGILKLHYKKESGSPAVARLPQKKMSFVKGFVWLRNIGFLCQSIDSLCRNG